MTISELRVQGEDGVVLAASLSLPERTPAPALVALHGAQPGLRDFPLFEHLHETLPPAGIAVVTFDRRGEGASTGEPAAGRFEVLAADANAVVETVAALDEIDARRVGLGGSARAAGSHRSRRYAPSGPPFLVLLSSCGVTPGAQMLYAMQEQVRRAGFGEDAVGQVTTLMRSLDDILHGRGDRERAEQLLAAAHAEPWWSLMYLPGSIPPEEAWTAVREELDFEPAPVFSRVRVPTLLFYGEDDEWIPIDESIRVWRRACGDEVEIVRLPGTGHEPVLASGEVSPLYTETLLEWLTARS